MKRAPGRRDQRRFDRRRAELAVTVSANDGQKITAGITLDSADVSEGGAFLRSDLLFEIGETLHLEIPLPDGPTIKTRGRVVRVRRAGTGGMGIEFLGLSSQDRKALTAGLTKLASSKTNRLS